MHCNAIDTTGGQVCHWIDPTYINLQLMCLCHPCNKMYGDVEIDISDIWRIKFEQKNMENHVVNSDLQEVKFLHSVGIFGPDCLQSSAALKKTWTFSHP